LTAPPRPRPPLANRLALGVAVLATVVGTGWRLVDVREWPFPFFNSVQYESALAARALWVAADPAARTPERVAWFEQAKFRHIISPPVLPALVAASYAVAGEEIPWASKLFAAAFWAGAGWLVRGAVVRQTGGWWAGTVALTVLLFAPFGLLVSRSFQTESAAVFALALGVWHLSRPGRGVGWPETAVAGLVCGLAGLVKPGTLLPPLAAGFAALMLSPRVAGGFPRKVACIFGFTLLLALPSGVYVALLLSDRGGEIQPHLLADAAFYDRLLRMARGTVGLRTLGVGLVGAALAVRSGWPLAAGLFAGYVAYVGIFTYHCSTHDYYHTTLLVPVALGVGWVASLLLRLAAAVGGPSRRTDLIIAAVVCAGLARYVVASKTPWVGPWRHAQANRPQLAADRDREQRLADVARTVRAAVRPGGRAVAVTNEYGYVFEYWADLRVAVWPRRSDMTFLVDAGMEKPAVTADDRLAGYIAVGIDYVIVVDFAEYERQPDLAAALGRRGKVVVDTPEVRVFDLR